MHEVVAVRDERATRGLAPELPVQVFAPGRARLCATRPLLPWSSCSACGAGRRCAAWLAASGICVAAWEALAGVWEGGTPGFGSWQVALLTCTPSVRDKCSQVSIDACLELDSGTNA